MKVKTPSKVLLVEDDYIQAEWITEMLERAFPYATVEPMATEAEFYSSIERIASPPGRPDVVLMDVMLPWAYPTPDMSPPPDNVRREGYRRAGLRCAEMLANREATKNIPVILFTVLTQDDLEAPTSDSLLYVSKESEPEELISRIRNVLTAE